MECAVISDLPPAALPLRGPGVAAIIASMRAGLTEEEA